MGMINAVIKYLAIVTAINFVWEILHLPLYTIWKEDGIKEQAFAVVHCTGGDALIAFFALIFAILVVRAKNWPDKKFFAVVMLAVIFGISYTTFSEWMNVEIRSAWAYSDLMPTINFFGFDVGLSPLLQWLVIPVLGFTVIGRDRQRSRKV